MSQNKMLWPRTRGCAPHVIVWVDFNTPHASDKVRLSELIQTVKHSLSKFPSKSIAMFWMPDNGKENCTVDDEVTSILAACRLAKLVVSDQLICTTKPSGDRENYGNAAWWTSGRLVTLEPKVGEAENCYLAKSQLVRRARFAEDMVLPLPEELVVLTITGGEKDETDPLRTDDVHMDKGFKAAQKGFKVAASQIQGLLEQMPLCPRDTIAFLDILPYCGDRAKAVKSIARTPGQRAQWYYLGLAVGHAAKTLEFPKRRIALELGKEFLNQELELHIVDANGKAQVLRPNTTVPEPTADDLKIAPGALQAWEGLSTAQWRVLVQSGSSLVIQPKWNSELLECPPIVAQEYQRIKEMHKRDFEGALTDLTGIDPGQLPNRGTGAEEIGGEGDTFIDRAGADAELQDPPEIHEYQSKEELPPAVIDVKAMSGKGVQLLRDQQGNSYLLSSTDLQLLKHSTIGSFGSGVWGGYDPKVRRAVKFEMLHGDRTVVILKKQAKAMNQQQTMKRTEKLRRRKVEARGTKLERCILSWVTYSKMATSLL